MHNIVWDSNLIQFARMLCEINATQDIDIIPLCESMDLEPELIIEIMDRADEVWEATKAEVFAVLDGPTLH